jgi:hypothetical protein
MFARMKAIVDAAKRENRGLSSAEAAEYDRLHAQYDRVNDTETRGAYGAGYDQEHRDAFSRYLRYGEITRELRTNRFRLLLVRLQPVLPPLVRVVISFLRASGIRWRLP